MKSEDFKSVLKKSYLIYSDNRDSTELNELKLNATDESSFDYSNMQDSTLL